jgi:hypothetical protein
MKTTTPSKKQVVSTPKLPKDWAKQWKLRTVLDAKGNLVDYQISAKEFALMVADLKATESFFERIGQPSTPFEEVKASLLKK